MVMMLNSVGCFGLQRIPRCQAGPWLGRYPWSASNAFMRLPGSFPNGTTFASVLCIELPPIFLDTDLSDRRQIW